jgi:cupin fold WbuC family metalloprotein
MKLIAAQLIDALIAKAGASERRRANHNVHESPGDSVQRLFVAAKRDSYFRPHRHPVKWEFAVVLRGLFDIILLDDNGLVTKRLAVGPGADAFGFELPANAWHTWVPMEEDSVFMEVKQGPYDAQTAAEFAAWSPAEGTPQVGRFVEKLRKAKAGDRVAD